MAKFRYPPANTFHRVAKKDFKMGCCDCGLVHNVDFRVVDSSGKEIKGAIVHLKVRRNSRSTAQVRRHAGIKFEPRVEIECAGVMY